MTTPLPHTLEMSRYIDLEIYHAVERTHPFYVEMIDAIHGQLDELARDGRCLRAWEFGAGTGLATLEFARHAHLDLDAVELDFECLRALEQHVARSPHAERVTCLQGDALCFGRNGQYDVVLSTFAHDHIPDDRGVELARNIRRVLRRGGGYIMGGEILPFFETAEERREALYRYHGYIIQRALREGHFEVAQIEINALKSGLLRLGDFKRHEAMFEAEMASAELALRKKVKLGPADVPDVGGVFVYVYEAI